MRPLLLLTLLLAVPLVGPANAKKPDALPVAKVPSIEKVVAAEGFVPTPSQSERDRKHQPLLNPTRPNPARAIRRLAALPQPTKPRKSPRRHRPQAQKPPRAWPGTEPSPPVANPASGNQLRPSTYGGPRAERPSDPSTLRLLSRRQHPATRR